MTNASGLVIGEVVSAAKVALLVTKAIIPNTSADFPITGDDIQPLPVPVFQQSMVQSLEMLFRQSKHPF